MRMTIRCRDYDDARRHDDNDDDDGDLGQIGHDGDVMTMGSDGGYDDSNDDSVS